jgi:cell wall-associated NlpC family hydrolase
MPSISDSLPRRALRGILVCAIVASSPVPAHAQGLTLGPADGVDAVKPFAALNASVHGLRDSLVSLVRAQVGTRYVHGGDSPARGFDCSGLVRYVMAGLHVPLPRTAAEQARSGFALARDTTWLRPGDLLTFGKERRGVSHIGIYVGNGRFVHASSVAGRVVESNLDRPRSPLIKPWRGARRVLAATDSTGLGDS